MRLLVFNICLLLSAFTFSTAAVAAQEQLSQTAQTEIDSRALLIPDKPYSIAEYRAASIFDHSDLIHYPQRVSLYWIQASTNQPKSTKAPEEKIKIKRTAIDPSMVGYIDNAVVHSEVRVRFDAAMDDTTPDRAEFFYAKCGCYAFLPLSTGAQDLRTPGPGPGIPRAVNFQQLYFYGEYAPHPHFSLFMQLPFRWLQAQSLPGVAQAFPNAGGFGDVQVGLKFAPLVSPRHYLTFQFRAYTPTGDAGLGLGTHHYSVEPSLLYYQRLTERASVEAEVGDTHPLGTSSGVPTVGSSGFAGDVFFYGVGPSYQFVRDEKFGVAGVLEVVGWNVRSGFVTSNGAPVSTSGVNIVNMKVGPRMSFGAHHSWYIGYGIGLTSEKWYRQIFRTEYRYSF
jgi:hypothetical protein